MVNRTAVKKSAQRSKENQQNRKDMLWKVLSFWEEDKDAVERNKKLKKGQKKEPELMVVPRHITVLTKLSDAIENVNEHDWQGNKKLKPPVVCPRLEYEDDYCEVCSTEAKYPCRPEPYGKVLVYVHDYVGQVYRTTDRAGNRIRRPYEVKRVLRIPRNADGAWEKLEELNEAGVLRKTVLQVKQTKSSASSFKLVEASDRVIRGLANNGKIPRECREEVSEYDTDFCWQHLLNTANGVRFEHWGVEEPTIERGKVNDEDSGDDSYPDDEDEDEEYNSGEDEDEDDDDRAARRSSKKKSSSSSSSKKPAPKSSKSSKSSSKPSAKPKRKVDDDEDDDYDDESEDDEDDGHWSDEDDEDEEPSRKSKSKTVKPKTKPSPKAKTKSKPPAPKSKRKSKAEDDDEFEDDDEELEDDFDDDFEEDEDEEDDD